MEIDYGINFVKFIAYNNSNNYDEGCYKIISKC